MANKQLILHIGRPKTGTSSIQHFLARNADALGAEGAIYPRAGRALPGERGLPVAHHSLAAACAGKLDDKAAFAEMKRVFTTEIAGHDTVVISSESFSNLVRLDLLREFFDDFARFDRRVIVYLREYLSSAISSFQQAAQRGREFRTFSQFLARESRIADFIARWSAIGPIDFRPFERERLDSHDVVMDFLKCAGLGLRPTDYADANPSIGGNLLYAKLVATHLGLPLLDYMGLMAVARSAPRYRGGFFIDAQRAATIRGQSGYNDIVMRVVGPLGLKSYDACPVLPRSETLVEDLTRFREFGDIAEAEQAIRGFSGDTSGWF
ncbi:MAG: hypothetical protein H7X93_08030 [Sphingomonadaceae bacterium]|nr:hypothetical protein [Sphingomonadaceae bacterium]